MGNFIYILEYIKNIIDYIAVIIMVWGLFLSLIKFVKYEFKTKNDSQQIINKENLRAFLATYILLGLEILIVADIIAIIINPSQSEIINLVIIVVVRTIISFFLERDFRDILGYNRHKQ